MMDLWLIEFLCFGAEVTAALLLIAFAWQPPAVAIHVEEAGTMDWEPTKRTYIQFWLHRGLYLQRWKTAKDIKKEATTQLPDEPCNPHFLATDSVEIYLQLIPEPWRDRLTSLVNRQGFDAILNAWSTISPDHRSVSCVSLFSLNDYSTLVSNHGAMTIEQALRAVATYLQATMSHTCIVARYQPDRFAVLHFSESLADCHYLMEDVQDHIASDSFFRVNDEPLSMRCVVSIVDLLEDVDLVTQMDALEEGNLTAADNDSKVVSQVGGEWVEKPPEDEGSRRERERPSASDIDLTNTRQSSGSSTTSSDVDDEDVPKLKPISEADDDDNEIETDAEDDLSTQDISAVASTADIEALFAQINSKKQATHSATTASNAETAFSSDSQTIETGQDESPFQNADMNETATADDIAELVDMVRSAITVPAESDVPFSEATALPIGNTMSESTSPDDISSPKSLLGT